MLVVVKEKGADDGRRRRITKGNSSDPSFLKRTVHATCTPLGRSHLYEGPLTVFYPLFSLAPLYPRMQPPKKTVFGVRMAE